MSGARNYASTPFLKWAGGKRWLAPNALALSPQIFNRYYEPFLGSGAMFFGLRPRRAVLSDTNEELINCYREIRADWTTVWSGLKEHAMRHSYEFYYAVRDLELTEGPERAIRFLYLNRACFNGIYRVNFEGKFNVPKGSRSVLIHPYDNFEEVSNALSGVQFLCSDFEDVINKAGRDDFVFCDPPYTVTHRKNGFIRYNDKLFRWDDQIRLRDSLVLANQRGAFILLSNADFVGIYELYKPKGFRFTSVSRPSLVSGKSTARGFYGEVLISNYRLRIGRDSNLFTQMECRAEAE